MVFSSVTFLFYFLPAFLACYFLMPGTRARNIVLLVFSIVFYGWGGVGNLGILAASIIANYYLAILIDTRTGDDRRKALCLAIGINLAGLVVFKYTGFIVANINTLLSPLSVAIPVPKINLPLGISFFTFHAISYLVDVYRARARANPRLEEIAVYITMFPQLVAGPIVRYSTISHRIRERRTTLGRVSAGLRIFVIGLSWKVLIADEIAPVVASVFAQSEPLSMAEAWLGVTAYALQLYFDFGGYSNMAIGLAVAMGLKFPRNFNLPYRSLSVGEFWRRWHMSLSTWFRDYVYIPLGGNREGHLRTTLNLWSVFLLCGLWHGASWTYVIWGAHHGAFLALERTRFGTWLKAAPRAVGFIYTQLVVLTGWAWFRAESFDGAIALFRGMAGLNGIWGLSIPTLVELQWVTVLAMVIGWPLAIFGLPKPGLRSLPSDERQSVFAAGDTLMMTLLFVLCVLSVGVAAYSPFLYFQF